MGDPHGPTLGSTATPGEQHRQLEERAFLVRVLEADRPLAAPPARHALVGLEAVALGRGPDAAVRTGAELDLQVADRWMSSRHARIEASFGRWLLLDAGSKNGTFANGERVTRHELRDGDLLEIGRTFFLFRRQRLSAEVGDLAADALPADPGFATLSPGLGAELDRLAQLAATPLSILLLGESGTGKEVLASALHRRSARAGELVGVNCAAIAPTLIESELFGHKKGAFSGAVADHPGLVRSADGGTLFLDEIGDLPAPAQATLLRVLQEREVRPVGATRAVPVDLRLVSATHRDLERSVEQGSFRRDLFARIAGYRFVLPPLRQRREDLGLIAAALLRRAGAADDARIDPAAARALLRHDWPLNARELDNCLTAALHLAAGGALELEHLPPEVRAPDASPPATAPAASAELAADRAHRDELETLLREHQGNVSAIARALGKDRKQVQRWLKRHQLDAARYRS